MPGSLCGLFDQELEKRFVAVQENIGGVPVDQACDIQNLFRQQDENLLKDLFETVKQHKVTMQFSRLSNCVRHTCK